MIPEEDQTRSGFKLKERVFERLNAPAGGEQTGAQAHPPEDALSGNPAARGQGDSVEAMLIRNTVREKEGGGYDLGPLGDEKRRRRIWTYWLSLVAVDAPLAAMAWYSGHSDPVPFVFSLAGMAYFTGSLTWEYWFLRTD